MEKSKVKQMMHILLTIWILINAILGMWVGVMYIDNKLPYELKEGAVIKPDPAKQGSVMTVTWPIKQHRHCRGIVQRALSSETTGWMYFYDPFPAPDPIRDGDTVINKVFKLPDQFPAGKVYYDARVCFQCNVLQSIFPNMLCTNTPQISFTLEDRQ